MTVLVSANAKNVGNGGFGTLGSLIPPESFFYDDVDDLTAEWRGEITRFPSGNLFAFNNGEFTYEGEDSSFDYTFYKNGTPIGSYTVTLGEGATGANILINWPFISVSSEQAQVLPAGAATVSVNWPMISISSSQASQVPQVEFSTSITWPIFSFSSSQEVIQQVESIAIGIAWPMLSVLSSQQSTVPNNNLEVSINWPLFLASALSGDFQYFTAKSARVDITGHSRRIDL